MSERTISLTKGRVLSLTKSDSKGGEPVNILKVRTGLRWGQIKMKNGRIIKPEPAVATVPAEDIIKEEPGFWKKLGGNILGVFTGYNPTSSNCGCGSCSCSSDEFDYRSVDLDSSIICYNSAGSIVDTIYYGQKRSMRSSSKSDEVAILHHGDDTVGTQGDVDSDNETIDINLSDVSDEIKYLTVVLNSYSGDKFDAIPFAAMRIYAGTKKNEKVFAEYKVTHSPEFAGKVAMILGTFYRNGSNWEFKADGRSSNEHSISSIAKGSAKKVVKELMK